MCIRDRHYVAARRVEKPVFGLAVYHESGTHVTGPNTHFGGWLLYTSEAAGQRSRVDLGGPRFL